MSGTTAAPLNVLVQPGTAASDLAAAGVARISTGSLLFRVALGALTPAFVAIRERAFAPDAATPSYAEVVREN